MTTSDDSTEPFGSEPMRQAADEIRGWPEPYGVSLAAWMDRTRENWGDVLPSQRKLAVQFARDVMRDAEKAARMTERINRARR